MIRKLIAGAATAALAVGATAWAATQSQAAPASTSAQVPATTSVADPTSGLTRYTDTYVVQHPYNLPTSARFSITNGEYNAWILKGDKPFKPGSTTGARTELRWATDWSGGERLWEADVQIDPGTTGTAIMQVHVEGPGEAIYIQTKNGNLYNSVDTLLARNIVGTWFHLAAAYNPTNHVVQIWVNNALALTTHYIKSAGTAFYFKNGVYNLAGAKSQTHFKNIQLWRQSTGVAAAAAPAAAAVTAAPTDWSRAVVDSTMKRFPDPTTLGGWGYQVGLFLYGTDLVYQRTHNPRYLAYIKGWVDHFVDASGHISNSFNSLDSMQAGNLLILLNQQTGQAKYATAAKQIRTRLNTYPRTPDGGFWHATSKTNQLWLDGTYMVVPFLLRYGAAYGDSTYADGEAGKQITVYGSHLESPTGLLYHAYSLNPISWADPTTHHSSQFWCRSIGWYGMASLATLDALPATDPHRATILTNVRNLVAAIGRYQDPATGRWFQVVDKGSLSSNWTETSCSSMFTFIVAKSVALGYVPAADQAIATKGLGGVMAEVSLDSTGMTQIKNICIGTNVGDLSYYLSRPRATNDFHGLGAFLIMNEWMQGNHAG